MKRLFALLALTAATLTAAAQQRLVLIEEFTNTGCGPCATWSPELDSLIHYRLGHCIAIKYHSLFPDHSDPFHLYQPDAHQAKVDFYHITGVPTTLVDGVELVGRSFASLDAAVSYQLQQPCHYALTVEKTLTGRHLDVAVQLSPLAGAEANPNLRLFVAAIEEHIESSLPWPNGEQELNYTMRRMLTPVDGCEVAAQLSADSPLTWQGAWDDDIFDDLRQLGVVAYVQDVATHEVVATAYSGPAPEQDDQMSVLRLSDTPDLICQPRFEGTVILRNEGRNVATSATLNVSVNGTVRQYPWRGELAYLERDTMTFADLTGFQLAAEGDNVAQAWLSDVNSSDYTSPRQQVTFSNAVQAVHGVRLRLYTDKKPEETTWQLTNSAGTVVQQGGPYQEARKFITVDLDLAADDCYQLLFLDAGGDGIKGDAGNGYYQLYQVNAEGKQTRLAQGDYSGASHIVNFGFRLSDGPEAAEPRLVLFEEFTNTSCDPCAEFSPWLDKVIFERMDEMVPITYHLNFPSNRDPFYLANPADVMARAELYGVSGVPSLRVDGQHQGAWGYEQFLGYYIDEALRKAPEARIATRAELLLPDDGSDDATLHLQTSVLPLADTSGRDLRLFAAIVEERIEWSEPAANGERSWNYVMRKLLPTAEGQPLPQQPLQATPYEYEMQWPVEGFTNTAELGIVTFVQDMATLEVLNAAYTPYPAAPAAAKILSVANTPDRICTPLFTADLLVRNTGTETLTSATICASINGREQRTPWTGQLAPLARTTLRIPAFTDFDLSADAATPNDVELWLDDLNGNSAYESQHRRLTIANAHQARHAVRLTIMTDQQPQETTWAVFNAAGDVVCQGGPYSEPRKRITVDLPLTADDCYLLELEDEGGDGIEAGRGYIMLHEVDATGKTRLLTQQTYDTALHDIYFSLRDAATNAIATPATTPATTDGPAYDLGGRRADGSSHIIIYKDKKIIQQH